MSREIKFRAWIQEYDDCPGKMEQLPMQLQKFDFEDGTVLSFTEYPQHWAHECYGVAKPFVYDLMQFTGLKDKNGTDIYEGDIVAADGSESVLVHDMSNSRKFVSGTISDSRKLEHRRSNYLVYWQEKFACYNFKPLTQGHSINAMIGDRNIEVIGNRFQNPELL